MEHPLIERVRQNINSGSGIWPRSSSNRYFIFCVGTDIIKQKAFMSFAHARDIGVKPLMGSYKGQPEQSFIANTKDYDTIFPWIDGQESILLIGACNSQGEPKATLHYLKTEHNEELGYMRCVTREEAMRHESWTYDPFLNAHFICR